MVPSTSTTRHLTVRWRCIRALGIDSGPALRRDRAAQFWAHTTARLQSETERSLADEAAGPLAQLLAVPTDGGSDGGNDPLKMLKADVRGARGKALLLETVASGWGEGKSAAPRRDWQASRLGPDPPSTLAEIRRDTFSAVLAATGTPPSLFTDADGTSQREAVRRWHLGTVLPLARILEHELTGKLEAEVRLHFDAYPRKTWPAEPNGIPKISGRWLACERCSFHRWPS